MTVWPDVSSRSGCPQTGAPASSRYAQPARSRRTIIAVASRPRRGSPSKGVPFWGHDHLTSTQDAPRDAVGQCESRNLVRVSRDSRVGRALLDRNELAITCLGLEPDQ